MFAKKHTHHWDRATEIHVETLRMLNTTRILKQSMNPPSEDNGVLYIAHVTLIQHRKA